MNREILEINEIIDQIALKNNQKKNNGIFTKIDLILEYTASFNKYRINELALCILFHHNDRKLIINSYRSHKKYIQLWRLNNILLNDEWIMEEIKRKFKNF